MKNDNSFGCLDPIMFYAMQPMPVIYWIRPSIGLEVKRTWPIYDMAMCWTRNYWTGNIFAHWSRL
jgi:hypothetical protein